MAPLARSLALAADGGRDNVANQHRGHAALRGWQEEGVVCGACPPRPLAACACDTLPFEAITPGLATASQEYVMHAFTNRGFQVRSQGVVARSAGAYGASGRLVLMAAGARAQWEVLKRYSEILAFWNGILAAYPKARWRSRACRRSRSARPALPLTRPRWRAR
jgi:hypothetical protein